MDFWILCAVTLIVFIGIFSIAIYLCIPKMVEGWHLWKKTDKSMYLSNAVAAGSAALFLLLAELVVFLRIIWMIGCTAP